MYILGIELKGNHAFMALVDKNSRCRHQQKLSLGDHSDPHQVATFHRAVARLIKPYSIASVKLTRTNNVASNANAIDLIRMETIFQLHFTDCLSAVEPEELDYWVTHHLVPHQSVNQFHDAITAAQFELEHHLCIIS